MQESISSAILCRRIHKLFADEIQSGKATITIVCPETDKLAKQVRHRLGAYTHDRLYVLNSFPEQHSESVILQIVWRRGSFNRINIKKTASGYAIIATGNANSELEYLSYHICNSIRWAILNSTRLAKNATFSGIVPHAYDAPCGTNIETFSSDMPK